MAAILQGVGKLAATAGFVGVAANSVLFNVDAGCRGVIFDRFRGVLQEVKNEGTHFLIPFVQTPHIYDVKTNPKMIRTATGSNDLQTVNVSLRILYRPEPAKLPQIYSELGLDYDERVLPSITNEVLKAVIARYNAEELITKRYTVTEAITKLLIERADQFGIILDDVALTHLTFSNEFTSAVEQKQIAQQKAEMARYRVEEAEQRKLAAVIRAEGDAEAAKLVSDAMQKSGEGLIEMRKLEAAEEISTNLSRNQRVTYLPSGQNSPGLLLNLQS